MFSLRNECVAKYIVTFRVLNVTLFLTYSDADHISQRSAATGFGCDLYL